jgi:hypothetical protein
MPEENEGEPTMLDDDVEESEEQEKQEEIEQTPPKSEQEGEKVEQTTEKTEQTPPESEQEEETEEEKTEEEKEDEGALQMKMKRESGELYEIDKSEYTKDYTDYSTAQFMISINDDSLADFKNKLAKAKGKKVGELVDEFVWTKMRKLKDVRLDKNDYWQNFKSFRKHLFPEYE